MNGARSHQALVDQFKRIGRLTDIKALLDWDQETQMPEGAVEARAEQMALIAGLEHEWLVSDRTRELLDPSMEGAAPANGAAAATIREAKRAYERAVRIPQALVERFAMESTRAKSAWQKARKASDFARFAPHLTTLVEIKREMAECIGYATEPYAALMDEFEPGADPMKLEPIFAELRGRLTALFERIRDRIRPEDDALLRRRYPIEGQKALVKRLAEVVHYSFERGRIDVSVHPFCTTIGGADDVRITVRYDERFLPASLFGLLHEAGHALYEQGLPSGEHRFSPIGRAVSLGIHESQSRLWENFIGRGRAFSGVLLSEARAFFPECLTDVTEEQWYSAVNAVKPSLIRVEADELTYNLHVILRFELERALFSGKLAIRDVPAAWNEKMRKTLGIEPPNDADGCLQDIHWSLGAFGYFPTYALGNLYAAQFFEKAKRDVPNLDRETAAGRLMPLLEWLRENIHRHGRLYMAEDLVKRITGRPLSVEPLARYLEEKFTRVCGVGG